MRVAFALVLFCLATSSVFAAKSAIASKLLSSVSSQIDANAPIGEIRKQLQTIVNNIRDEQNQHDTLYNTQIENCNKEESFRNAEISDAKNAMDQAEAELARCKSELADAEAALARNKQDQADTHAALERATDARQKSQAAYEATVQDHKAAEEAIDEAEELVKELISNPTLFQSKSTAFAQVTANLMAHSSKLKISGSFGPLAAALVQLSNVHSDQTTVNKILQLLANLRASINASEEDYDRRNEAEIASFEALKASLEKKIADLEAEELVLEEKIRVAKACIEANTVKLNSATAKFNRNTQLLNDAMSLCKDFKSEYVASKADREEQLKTLAEVTALFERKVSSMSGEVTGRVEEGFGNYQNHFSYEKSAEYQKKSANFNAGGAGGAKFARDENLEKF